LIKSKQNKDQKTKNQPSLHFFNQKSSNFYKNWKKSSCKSILLRTVSITSLCFLYKKVAAKFFQSLRKKPGQVGVHQGTEARVKNKKEIKMETPYHPQETPLA